MGGAVAVMLAARHPHLVGRLVIAEGNLDPGRGLATVHIAAYAEQAYIAEGHSAILRDTTALLGRTAATVTFFNSMTLADRRATHRTARSLSGERQPTFRDLLEGLTIVRTYLIGERSQMDESKQRLLAAGIPCSWCQAPDI